MRPGRRLWGLFALVVAASFGTQACFTPIGAAIGSAVPRRGLVDATATKVSTGDEAGFIDATGEARVGKVEAVSSERATILLDEPGRPRATIPRRALRLVSPSGGNDAMTGAAIGLGVDLTSVIVTLAVLAATKPVLNMNIGR